jgi:hypothetical protein
MGLVEEIAALDLIPSQRTVIDAYIQHLREGNPVIFGTADSPAWSGNYLLSKLVAGKTYGLRMGKTVEPTVEVKPQIPVAVPEPVRYAQPTSPRQPEVERARRSAHGG